MSGKLLLLNLIIFGSLRVVVFVRVKDPIDACRLVLILLDDLRVHLIHIH